MRNKGKDTAIYMVDYAIGMMKWAVGYYSDDARYEAINRWHNNGSSAVTLALGIGAISPDEAKELDGKLDAVYRECREECD